MASADKQAARNQQILIARAQGEDVNTIAARHDLSPTRVQQILAKGIAVLADADDPDLVQIALERRAQYERLFEDARALFEHIPDTNPSPKVGALRVALAALDRLSGWEQTVGFIPENRAWIYLELSLRKFGDLVWEGLEEAGFPPDAVRQVIEKVTGAKREDASSIEVEPGLPPTNEKNSF